MRSHEFAGGRWQTQRVGKSSGQRSRRCETGRAKAAAPIINQFAAAGSGRPGEPAAEAASQAAVAENDYNNVILSLVTRYCPSGLLGLALTALAGLVHVGHGGQRDGFQHGLDLRPLPGLHRAQQERRPLHVDGPRGHGRGHPVEHRLRLFRDELQQRHGHHPVGLRLRQRAAVRHVPAWACSGRGRPATGAFLGLLGGIGTSALVHGLTIAEGKRPGHQGRLSGRAARVPQRNGPELLAGQFRLYRCFVLTLGISLWAAARRATRNSRDSSIR